MNMRDGQPWPSNIYMTIKTILNCKITNDKSHFHIKVSVFNLLYVWYHFCLLDIIVPGNSSLVAIELEGCFLADGSVS